LREVAERIENGQPPRDTCRRLAVFAAELQSVLEDDYLTPTGDVSIDEARLRLAGGLGHTLRIWDIQPRDSLAEGVEKLERDLTLVCNRI
jgi:hypothetical protein